MRPGIYFSSDWHVGDAKALAFDRRPFKDLDHMHRVLVNNYNATVGPEDTCYFLGDMGLCKNEVLGEVLAQLNGTKILILGNHDKGATAMRRMGFDVALNMAAIEVAGKLVTITHCPLRGVFREDVTGMRGAVEGDNWHGESKHWRYSLPDFGQFHLAGHIHSNKIKKGKSSKIHKRQFDVGVVANNYTPVSVSAIESWIATTIKLENTWVTVEGYPDYKINPFGTVKSYKRYPEGIIKNTFRDKDGYERVNLRVNNKSKNLPVHRLVARAFVPNPNNLPQVNHRNGVKMNNVPGNLEWCSNTHNQRHAWDSDLKTVKLTVSEVSEIKELIEAKVSNTEIALKYQAW